MESEFFCCWDQCLMDSKNIENDKYVEIKETITLFNWINVFIYRIFQRDRMNILIDRID